MAFEHPNQNHAPDSSAEELDLHGEELIQDFKAFSRAQIAMRNEVMENPDIEVDTLRGMMNEMVPSSIADHEYIDEVLTEFDKKRRLVGGLRDAYPKDGELFQAVFGFKPRGRVEVVRGPITLYFKCSNEEDYIDAYSGVRIHHLTDEEANSVFTRGSRSGGMLAGSRSLVDPNYYGAILVEKPSKAPKQFREEGSLQIRRHEEMHAWNRLWEGFYRDTERGWLQGAIFSNVSEGHDRNYYRSVLNKYLSGSFALDNIKDEMFAFFHGGSDAGEIVRVLQDSELYKYLSDIREWMIEESGSLPERNRAALVTAIEDVLVVRYNQIIKEAAEGMSSLVNEFNMSPVEAASLLRFKRIDEWPQFVSEYRTVHEQRSYREYKEAQQENLERITAASRKPGDES